MSSQSLNCAILSHGLSVFYLAELLLINQSNYILFKLRSGIMIK